MSELKTLKDIRQEIKNPLAQTIDYRWVRKDTLRQEAIKRVKSNNTAGFTFAFNFEGKVAGFNYTKEKLITLDWVNLGEMIGFIDFFNITQEELK